jgi:putative ABC transport system permease protein
MLGDLEEMHHRRRQATGATRAWLSTIGETALIAVVLAGDRLRPALHPGQWFGGTDVRLGFRVMRRQPIITVTATVSLALGIGLFTVGAATVETVLFSRLPFEGGERFIQIRALQEPQRGPARLTADEYGAIASRASTLTHLGAVSQSQENVRLPSGTVDQATLIGITPTSLSLLPYAPVRGRLLSPADAVPGAVPVVMIGEAFWRRAFGAADGAIGARIDVGGTSRTVVGVAPNDVKFPSRPPDLWTPISEAFLQGRGQLPANVRLFGVLVPGRSVDIAQAQFSAIAEQFAPSPDRDGPVRLEVAGFTDLGPQAPVMAAAIIGVVIAVLIVVAANVANLILARTFLRSRELAVRASLGASRLRLVGQISVEVLLLCGVATLLGSVAAQAVLRQFNAMDDLPAWIDFTAGPRTSVLVVCATLLATTIAGAWPALRITRGDLLATLQSGNGRGSDVRFGRMAGAMVVVQIALSIVMLHGAVIFADSVAQYGGRSLDVPANVLTTVLRFGVTPPNAGGPPRAAIAAEEVEAAASALPGVIAAGLATELPRHSPPTQLVEIEELPGTTPSAPRPAPVAEVSAGFFKTLDATPRAGRLFDSRDHVVGAPLVAVVNVPFVQKFLVGAFPLGRRFRTVDGTRSGPWYEIVGVVPDLGLSVGDPSLAAGYYVPLDADAARSARRAIYLTVRTTDDPLAYVGTLRQALHQRDPTLVLNSPKRLEDVAGDDRAFFRWFATALIGLGVVTLVLALTGVYAMMALIVTRRTREIGVRVALGATAQRIIRTVVGRATWQVALGGAIGAALAVLSLDLRGVLVSRLGDGGTWTLPIVLVLLVLAGLAATGLPLRRALRIHPSEAMRVE